MNVHRQRPEGLGLTAGVGLGEPRTGLAHHESGDHDGSTPDASTDSASR